MRVSILFVLLLTTAAGGLLAGRAAKADVLELVDGRLVEGVVVQQDDVYLVHSRFGIKEIPAAEVKVRRKAESIDAQVRAHLASLDPDDMENRALLARWLRDLGRTEEGTAMAETVLEKDPENAVAHEVLGHIRHQGVWQTPDEAKRSQGLEKHGDAWYTPAEWAGLEGDARTKALDAEKEAWKARMAADVNRAVRLMMSPDAKLRARGKAKLEALAREYDNPSLVDLTKNVAAYVKALDEWREKAAAGRFPAGSSGLVTGEFRATVSRLKRPIRTFETSLASSGSNAPVKIELPELEVIRVRTGGAIPVVVR